MDEARAFGANSIGSKNQMEQVSVAITREQQRAHESRGLGFTDSWSVA